MRVLLLLAVLSCSLLYGADAVSDSIIDKILKLPDKFRPAANWTFLKFDNSFSLKFEHPNSFIRSGTCLQVIDGKFYIVDNNRHKVVIFDEQGMFKQKFGQPGQGPGDLQSPGWMSYNNKDFVIEDNNGINIFGKDLKFKDRIRPFFTIYRFDMNESYFYCNIVGSYRGRHPLVLKLDRTGKVINGFYDQDVEKSNLKLLPDGNPLIMKDSLAFIPEIWNTIYVLDKDLELKKKIKVKYELLDELEKINAVLLKKSSRQKVSSFTIYESAKVDNDKLYILLGLQRLEILQVDLEGNIREHFYNDTDFRFMRWCGFAVDTIDKRTVFYVMGYSLGKEKGRDLSELGVFRMTIDPVKKINK